MQHIKVPYQQDWLEQAKVSPSVDGSIANANLPNRQSNTRFIRCQSSVDGNIFEIRTKDYPVTIERMDIHMKETATVLPIAVWYRPGEANPLYDESYVNAIDANMIGNGMNVLTSLPAFPTPIVLPARTTYTFYVTTSKNGEEALYYGMGSELGKAYVSDDFLEIGEGYAMRYSFSSPAFPRQWNGKSTLYSCV
jgi:hypothetical protein